jgi:hypothetical protein
MNPPDRLTQTPFSATALAAFAATYAADGVVHVPGLLSVDWVQRLVDVLAEARRTLTGEGGASPAATGEPATIRAGVAPGSRLIPGMHTAEWSSAPGRFTIRWLWRDLDSVRRFFTDSGVAPVVAAVIGARRLQYWYDLTFIHDPLADGAGTPWHHDIAAFPCKGTQIPSLWIALSDIGRDMAPLQCIRGSHRNPLMFRPPIHVDAERPVPPGYAELPDVEARIAAGDYERITWEVKAGDALIIHPNTLHGAPSNRADRTRIAFTTRWAGDDVVWKPDVFSMRVPGVDLAAVPVGERPSGPLFPFID